MAVVAQKNDVLIAVVGVTGAGKSTFINKATGQTTNTGMREGNTLRSCTQKVEVARCQIGGKWVCLIDTPGFDDTNVMDSETLKSIADFLHLSYRDNKLLHGVILLQPIDGTRVTGSEKRRTRLFEKICGPNAYARIVIATTMWGNMTNQSDGDRKMQERISDREFWGAMVSQGAKVEKHQNNTQSARRIVSMVVNNPKVVLQMQRELDQNEGRVYSTSAGRQLDADLDQTGDQTRREIQKLQGERNALEEIQELREQLAKVEEDRQRLRNARTSWQLLTPAWLATLITGFGVALASPLVCTVQ